MYVLCLTDRAPDAHAVKATDQADAQLFRFSSLTAWGDFCSLEVDTVAWSSVQIICQCTVSESRVQLPRTQLMSTEEASSTGCDTSFVPNKGQQLSELCLIGLWKYTGPGA